MIDKKITSNNQDRVCTQFGAPFSMPDNNELSGISTGFFENPSTIIHGLRHPREDGVSGWYLWKGEYSTKKKFFQAMHIEHVIEMQSELAPYLALPPGWRFLIDTQNGHEDVWRDTNLL